MTITFHPDGRIDGFNAQVPSSSLPAGSVVQVQSTTSTAGSGSGSAGPNASGLVTTLTPLRAGSKFFVTASGMSMHCKTVGCASCIVSYLQLMRVR